MNRSALAFLLILSGCHPAQTATPALPEGVYTMCEEVVGYSGETIELKNGRFRYWFYSDVVNENNPEPAYPLEGRYSVSGSTLSLDHPKIYSPQRTLATVNGVPVLWREDGLKLWKSEERLHPYAVLIRVEAAGGDQVEGRRPSISLLETAKMRERDRKEYEERHNDQPEEVRVLLRARSMNGDPDMDLYKREVGKARVQPSPKLLSQLVGLLGRNSRDAIAANSILTDLYTETWLIKSPPPFLSDPAAKKRAFESLIAALASAKDRSAIESSVMLFLRAAGIVRIDLPVPGTELRIILEPLPGDGGRYASEGTPIDDVNWLKRMPKVIPACQEWMSTQLPK